MNDRSERLRLIREQILAAPFAADLALQVSEATSARFTLTMAFAQAHTTYADVVHGGAIATLADIAAVTGAVWHLLHPPASAATMNLSIAYLAPASGMHLKAVPVVLRSGARNHVVRVEVVSGNDRPIAEALASVVLR